MALHEASPGKQNLPGWSLAREGPKQPKKQGWECPAPTVEDWEDYKKWTEQQERKDELPSAPQIFLADSSLLYYQDPDVQLPWIHRLKCELPRRVGRLSGELPTKASYIGFGTEDDPEQYELFKQAVAQIGIVLCRQIHNPPSRFEIAHLEQSDLVLVGGGDRKRLWQSLGTDYDTNAVAEHVKWRYLQGAVVIAIGEAMSLLGEKSWYTLGKSGNMIPYKGWKIFPHVVAPEDPDVDLEDLVEQLGGAGVVVLGVHPGCGMIFNKDGLVEPVRGMIQEYRWDWQSNRVKQALLLGPPRSTGLICPLYAAMNQQADEEGANCEEVFCYALTREEEGEEEDLLELYDPRYQWISRETRQEVDTLKELGNAAFKAGKADAAGLKYEQARVLLKSSARGWRDLDDETRQGLTALDPGQREEHRATALLTAILLNQCACHLLAHDQDERRRRAEGADCASDGREECLSEAQEQGESTLVEVRDNLVAAFRASNEALRLSGGQSAKAWYRRGTVFEKMRDPRNAERDFEEALARASGDKAISRKREEVKQLASKVAESMYYARHRELDTEEDRLGLGLRTALLLLGSFGDSYRDERQEFPLAQPVARLVEGTLEEREGKAELLLGSTGMAMVPGAPYLHPQALWTWEFLVQRSPQLRFLHIEDVDLGAGPLEWLAKGLRTHKALQVLRFVGVHVGPGGGKMLGNVLAQNASLLEIRLDACAMRDTGLDEIAAGLRDHAGCLELLSLRRNYFTAKRMASLADAICRPESRHSLCELDLSENPLGSAGAKEVARIIGSDTHGLRVLRLQDCCLDLSAFWRLVGNLRDSRPLSTLDLRANPIGRGTRRCWHGQMAPTLRCEVLLSDNPKRAWKELARANEESATDRFPLPHNWM